MPLEPDDREPSVVIDTLTDNPYRRTYPEDTILSDTGDPARAGPATDFAPLPNPSDGHVVVEDPQDPTALVKFGGDINTDDGIPVDVYYTESNTWDPGKYNNLEDDISALSDTDTYGTYGAAGVVGDTIVVAGGNISGTPDDRIFVLDTSVSSPTWSTLTSTCPNGLEAAAGVVYNDKLWVLGGSDGNANTTTVFTVDPASDTVDTSPSDTPAGVGFMDATRIGDKAYAAGQLASQPQGRLLIYDFPSDTWSTSRVWEDGGFGSPSQYGFGSGMLESINGYPVYWDGYQYFSSFPIAYYDPENDNWSSRDILDPGVRADDASPNFFGNKRGVIVDGVMYAPGTGNAASSVVGYIPETEPFGE